MTGITPGSRSYSGPTIPALDALESPSVLGGIGPDAVWIGPAGASGTGACFLSTGYAGAAGAGGQAAWAQTDFVGSVAISDEDVHGNYVATWLEVDASSADDVLTLVDVGAGVLMPQWAPASGGGSFLPLAGGTMTGPILGAVGSVGAPGYSFAGDTNTGIYRPAADVIGLAVAGVEVARVRAGGLGGLSVAGSGTSFGSIEAFRVNTPTTNDNLANTILCASAATSRPVVIQAAAAQTASLEVYENSAGTALSAVNANGLFLGADGAVGTPGFSFVGDTNTGIYRAGADDLRLVAGGAEVLRVAAVAQVTDGTAATPGLGFISDTNTGLYRIGADSLGISAGGTLRASVTTTALALADGINITIGSVTGTKIGTGVGDKIGFLGATPSSQLPPSGASGHATGSGTAVLALDTFTGAVGTAAYTIGDLVTALKLFGFINTN